MKFARIALRNISRQKRRTALLASAIAICIFIVTLINGGANGTIRVLKENLADMIGGHIFIVMQHKDADNHTRSYIDDDAKLVAALYRLGVRDSAISKTVDVEEGELYFNGKSEMQTLVGVAWNEGSDLREHLSIPAGDFAKAVAVPDGIVVSKKIADKLNLQTGDTVQYRCRTVSGQQNLGEFKVAYVTQDTSMMGSMVSFAPQAQVTALMNLPTPTTYLSLRVKMRSVEEAALFAPLLEKELAKDFKIAPKPMMADMMDSAVVKWNDTLGFTGTRLQITTINDFAFMPYMNQAAAVVNLVALFILVVLLFITMMGILNTFRMILIERVKEIGTMRAVGMHRNQVRRIMIYEAVFLALLGVAAGLVLALLGGAGIGAINFGSDSSASFLLNNGHISFKLDPGAVVGNTILVVVFTTIAALWPASRAAKLPPAEALRSTN